MSRSNTDKLCAVKQIAEQFSGLPYGVKRYHIVNALKKVGHHLGFNKRHIAYIESMVFYTKETDWEDGDCLPMVWLSVEEIALNLSISTRQVNRIEQALVVLGAVYQKDYGKGW